MSARVLGLAPIRALSLFCLVVMRLNISILGHGKGEVWTRPLLCFTQTTREETNRDTGYFDEVMLAHLSLLSLCFLLGHKSHLACDPFAK